MDRTDHLLLVTTITFDIHGTIYNTLSQWTVVETRPICVDYCGWRWRLMGIIDQECRGWRWHLMTQVTIYCRWPWLSMGTIDTIVRLVMAADEHNWQSIVSGDGYWWTQLTIYYGWRWLLRDTIDHPLLASIAIGSQNCSLYCSYNVYHASPTSIVQNYIYIDYVIPPLLEQTHMVVVAS